ncbi:BnaA05g33730D [Brassica napus]|uniref:BnaA05g33730D protein n=2 Tax=Brassica TaxID=3705 RepID=A0A078HKX8_BRANA|nr:BnaA05g33730D [Brassica napus]
MDSLRFNLQQSPFQLRPRRTIRPRITNISNQTEETDPRPPSSAGKIQRLVLNNEGRTKLNAGPDREFYSYPRFVNHVDDGFISSLTDLYRNRLRSGSIVLDLMSSWELARNPRLDYFFVKDLNEDQKLEFQDKYFDAVLCSVGVQYLQQPEKVFAEVYRVLKPGGALIVSFSNRMFYEKAIRVWRDGTEYGRVQLVVQYFQSVQGFTQPETIRQQPPLGGGAEKPVLNWFMGLIGLASRPDPFNAVIAYKNFKPLYE